LSLAICLTRTTNLAALSATKFLLLFSYYFFRCELNSDRY